MKTSGVHLLGIRQSVATLAADRGIWVDAEGFIVASETTETSFGAAEVTSATGVVGTPQLFRVLVESPPTTAMFRVVLRVPWTLTTQSAGAPTRGTMRASLLVNGAIAGTAGRGAPRNMNAANGTEYVELIELTTSTPVSVTQGMPIDIQIEPEITVASGVPGSSCECTLRHNPQAVGAQLVAEFHGLGVS